MFGAGAATPALLPDAAVSSALASSSSSAASGTAGVLTGIRSLSVFALDCDTRRPVSDLEEFDRSLDLVCDFGVASGDSSKKVSL